MTSDRFSGTADGSSGMRFSMIAVQSSVGKDVTFILQ